MIVFEVAALPYLIGAVDVNDIIRQQPPAIAEFLRNICGVFRYEFFSAKNNPAGHTTSATVKLVVVGATFLPELLYVACEGGVDASLDDDADLVDPEAAVDDEDEGDEQEDTVVDNDEGAQILQEEAQAQAKERVAEEHAAREAAEAAAFAAAAAAAAAAEAEAAAVRLVETEEHAAVRMQCLARGASSRSRVLKLRQQAQALRTPPPTEPEADVPEEAPLPPEPVQPVQPTQSDPPAGATPSPEKKRPKRPPPKQPTQSVPQLLDLKADLVINGTEVNIQGRFGADGLELQATEGQEQLQSRLVLSAEVVSAAMQRLFGDDITFSGILGAESTVTDGGDAEAVMANNTAQFAIFSAVCGGLDLFLSRKNGIITIKYKLPVLDV